MYVKKYLNFLLNINSSLRINGEDVFKIRRSMNQLREMKNSSDRSLRRMIILTAFLIFMELGVGAYA